MTQRLPQIRPLELMRVFEKLGFVVRRQTGSHVIMRHPQTGRITTIPVHARDVKRGLLFGILKQAGISQTELIDTL